MKKLIIALGLGLIIAMFNINTSNAQHISVNINLDAQPAWGPSGYDYAAFYYFPDLNIYYDINDGLFIYPSGRRWVSSIYLPKKYYRYDLYTMYKVVINDIYDPWMYNTYHKRNYAYYCNNTSQTSIYYVNDRHYHRAKQNYWAWVEPRYMPKYNDRDHQHLSHQHKEAQFNRNHNATDRPRYNDQVTNNNGNTKRNKQATASTNREEYRSSNARNNENRSSANKQNEVHRNENRQIDKSENRNTQRNGQAMANRNREESRSSNARNNENRSSANTQNEVRKNENRQVQNTDNRNTRSNEQSVSNSQRTETRSSGTRSNERNSSAERRSENNENKQAPRTESNSRSSGRSAGSRR